MPPLLRIGFILAFFNYVLSEASSRREKFGRSNLQRESYAPFESPCPSNDVLIRSAKNQSLSEDEVEFVDRHQANTQEDWSTWLKSSNPGPDLEALIVGGVLNYTSSVQRLPRIGLALSGGGYRAMINGAGILSGIDSRNSIAQQRGTAGLLQKALYVAGLSGGSWAVGSFAINDWPTVEVLQEKTWNLASNVVIPEDDAISFYADVVSDVAGKRDENYPTGIVDYWGRALSYHLVNSSFAKHGQTMSFVDIRNTSSFIDATYPLPIVIADEREPGQLLIHRNTTLFEFSPFEFGSFDPDVQAFIPMDILGSNLTNGRASSSGGNCTYGFDNFGFIMGTSSTLFNSVYNTLITTDGDSLIKDALQNVLREVSKQANVSTPHTPFTDFDDEAMKDVSVVPNPFAGYDGGLNFSLQNQDIITLVDGGEDNQNVPLATLLEPARKLDLVLAIDNSADVSNFPNGTALYETFLRYQSQQQFQSIAVPKIPSPTTFVNRGFNTRPTFFGCDATADVINLDGFPQGSPPPIIAYMPNYPWSTSSNTSTFKLSYDEDEVRDILANSRDIATLGGVTHPSSPLYWPRCLACVALERSFVRSSTPRPEQCQTCLSIYCWDGVSNDTNPKFPYSPPTGTPIFVTSEGQAQIPPEYTGGNGSNSDQSTVSSNSGDSVNVAVALPRSVLSFVIAVILLSIAHVCIIYL